MREAALLQGFPRRYKFPTTENKSAVALMIGNALPPPFIAAHGRSIKRSYGTAPDVTIKERDLIHMSIDQILRNELTPQQYDAAVDTAREVCVWRAPLGQVKDIGLPDRQTPRPE